MDIEPTNNNVPTAYGSTLGNNGVTAKHHLIYGFIGLIVVVLGMGSIYLWQHGKVTTLNDKLNNYQAALVKDSKISLDNVNALSALPNVVIDTANSPTDLIAYLGADNTQCYKSSGSGYYKVVAEANDQFAKMQYGCTAKGSSTPLGSSPAFILAKKVNNKWSLISPTNQWSTINGQDLPSCTMVNDNKVSKLVTPQCWQGSTSSSSSSSSQQPTVVAVTNP